MPALFCLPKQHERKILYAKGNVAKLCLIISLSKDLQAIGIKYFEFLVLVNFLLYGVLLSILYYYSRY